MNEGASSGPGSQGFAPEPASPSQPDGADPSRKPKPSLLDATNIVRELRLCANGMRSFKSDQGDYGICDDAADALEWAEWQRRYAISWANRSVSSVQERMWALEDGLRNLVGSLAGTGFHNSLEMAAARKLLRRDSDEHRNGEDANAAEGEACQRGPEASPSPDSQHARNMGEM